MGYCKYCMSEINDGWKFCPVCGKDLSKPEPVHHLQPGTLLAGKYVVGAALGEGGFGITYLGMNNKLGLKVAIKEYFPFGYVHRVATMSSEVTEHTEAADENFFEKGRERFLSEAKTLAKLYNQDGVVSVLDFFEENNTAYIVMEYLEGETLKAYLSKKGRLSYDETVSLLMPVMKSLSKVHEKGLIHRDISPDNIMITADKVKLLDFGAARYADGGNKSLSVVLKHGYAPEEQYRRKGEQGPWTDVYALCATIYKCITGATPDEVTERIYEDNLKKPSEYGTVISPKCEAALMKGLSVYAKNRYSTVDGLIKGLEGKDGSLAVAPEPEKDSAHIIPPVPVKGGEKTEALFDKKEPDPDKTVYGEDPYKTVFGEDPDKTVFGDDLDAAKLSDETYNGNGQEPNKANTNAAYIPKPVASGKNVNKPKRRGLIPLCIFFGIYVILGTVAMLFGLSLVCFLINICLISVLTVLAIRYYKEKDIITEHKRPKGFTLGFIAIAFSIFTPAFLSSFRCIFQYWIEEWYYGYLDFRGVYAVIYFIPIITSAILLYLSLIVPAFRYCSGKKNKSGGVTEKAQPAPDNKGVAVTFITIAIVTAVTVFVGMIISIYWLDLDMKSFEDIPYEYAKVLGLFIFAEFILDYNGAEYFMFLASATATIPLLYHVFRYYKTKSKANEQIKMK